MNSGIEQWVWNNVRFISLSFFRFKTARTHSTYRKRQKACCIASLLFFPFSLSLPFAFSRHTRVRSLSSSFVNDVTAFFLPRFQRVSTTMHVKSTRANIVTSRHRLFFLLSLSLFTISSRLLKPCVCVWISCKPYCPPPSPATSKSYLLVFVPLFYDPRIIHKSS